jgi:GntR family carbon starvation induced transcriptional regulator
MDPVDKAAEPLPATRSGWADARLRAAILNGELAPGERVRAEVLAEHWGISATPIREAVARLAGDGLVTLAPQRGARVAVVEAVAARELYEVRLALDPLALVSSMRHSDDEHRRSILAAHRALQRRAPDLASHLAAHRAFHLALMARCANNQLLGLVTVLHDRSTLYQLTASGHGRARRVAATAEHDRLADRVVAGDVDAAVEELERHLRGTLAAVTDRVGVEAQ